MDKHTQTLRWTQMLQAKKKLEDHQFQVDLFPTQKECLEYLKGLLKDQVSVSVGGSMTLFETGILDFLENNQDIQSVSYTHLSSKLASSSCCSRPSKYSISFSHRSICSNKCS